MTEEKAASLPKRILGVVFSRIVLIMHSILVIDKVTRSTGNNIYWLFTLYYILTLIDAIFVIKYEDYDKKIVRHCTPALAIHLCTVLPGFALLELEHLFRIREKLEEATSAANLSEIALDVRFYPAQDLFSVKGDYGTHFLEQLLFYVVIMARWIMPKGKLSINEVSILFFVYTAIASDTMELLVLFHIPDVARSSFSSTIILVAWLISLLQLGMLLYDSPRKSRGGATDEDEEELDPIEEQKRLENTERKFGFIKSKTDIQKEKKCLLIAFIFMDAPYITIRLYAMIFLKVVSYYIIFFFIKNLFMIVFSAYRLLILYDYLSRSADEDEEATDILFFNDEEDENEISEAVPQEDIEYIPEKRRSSKRKRRKSRHKSRDFSQDENDDRSYADEQPDYLEN